MDRIKVKYGVWAAVLEQELSGIKGALLSVQRFVEMSVPLREAEGAGTETTDPMKGVLASAISRVDRVKRVVFALKFV